MTTTKLEISSPRLHAAVHHVYGRLPSHVRERLGRVNLALITDAPHAALKARGADGLCERLPGGLQRIFLSPALASESDERIEFVVAHEIGHALQPWLGVDAYDETVADGSALAWGFEPTRYPQTDWKR